MNYIKDNSTKESVPSLANKYKKPSQFSKKEYGDYQTPVLFARKVIEYAISKYDINPELIIEPTCGVGNFIKASKQYFKNTPIVAIDINTEYTDSIREEFEDVEVYNEDVFGYDFSKVMNDDIKEYLVIGNPPWVTNTELSKFESSNLPKKDNFKNLDQFEAKTGMSNFDVSENIILHIINNFKQHYSTIIFLCKYKVACNIFEHLVKKGTYPAKINIVKFNAMQIFGIDAAGCILIMQFNKENRKINSCMVNNLTNPHDYYRIGIKNGKLYSNIDNDVDIDGKCPYEWRQGIKHDCVKVMELKMEGNLYKNKKDDLVELEEEPLYPLLKSSNLKKPVVTESEHKILITQHKLKEDTSYIEEEYPLTWDYLDRNREDFEKRKSSIYQKAPPYSIFGIGDYTFKKYKVAISGFYKRGLFVLVYNDKSMMLDDTCYYLSFDDYDEAYVTMLILNSDVVQRFLKNVVFLDSKRPYTKKVLKRIDIKKALNIITIDDLKETEEMLEIESYVTEDMFEEYVKNMK